MTVAECDACNRFVASAGLDGALRIWSFSKRSLLSEVPTGAPVERGALHRGSALLALAGADRAVRVFDAAASPPRRVRTFGPHADRVTDLAFGHDARWLLTASLDGLVRCWDVPSARLLQSLRLGAPVTSLSLSPGSELLATAHVGKRCADSGQRTPGGRIPWEPESGCSDDTGVCIGGFCGTPSAAQQRNGLFSNWPDDDPLSTLSSLPAPSCLSLSFSENHTYGGL